MDNFIKCNDSNLYMNSVALCIDKKINLVRVWEIDREKDKKYIRNAVILVDNIILTSTFADTVHFLEELSLFDFGNEQNKYLKVLEHQKNKNLKLDLGDGQDIYITKSEAKSIYKLYNMSLIGYSPARVLEYEYRFTPQNFTQLLHENNYLES